jgi:hypothetical protein
VTIRELERPDGEPAEVDGVGLVIPSLPKCCVGFRSSVDASMDGMGGMLYWKGKKASGGQSASVTDRTCELPSFEGFRDASRTLLADCQLSFDGFRKS